MATYEIWLCTDLGTRLTLLNDSLSSLEYVKVVNAAGLVALSLNGYLSQTLLRKDRQVQVWRAPTGGQLALDGFGLLRWWRYHSREGERATEMKAADANELLARRIVAYAVGSSQASVSTNADNAMKDVFNENLIGGAVAARDWSGNDVTVQGDLSAGTSLEKSFAWRTVLRVLKDLNEASRSDGNEVFFGLVPTAVDGADDRVQLQFQTWTGQPGQDRTWPDGSNPVIFGEAWGNLEEAALEFDYREEVNYVYAGGQGEEDARDTAEVSDADLINASSWGRREAFRDARHVELGNSAELTDEANAMLAEGRPRLRFTGKLVDTEQARYGLDWFLGDKVTAEHAGMQFDGIVRAVRVRLDEDGEEDVEAWIEAEINS
jgi:hypothetical protein